MPELRQPEDQGTVAWQVSAGPVRAPAGLQQWAFSWADSKTPPFTNCCPCPSGARGVRIQ